MFFARNDQEIEFAEEIIGSLSPSHGGVMIEGITAGCISAGSARQRLRPVRRFIAWDGRRQCRGDG